MEPRCHDCLYFFEPTGSGLIEPELSTCLAFYPEPIPDEIMSGEVAHDVPHQDQVNPAIVFLPATPLKKPK